MAPTWSVDTAAAVEKSKGNGRRQRERQKPGAAAHPLPVAQRRLLRVRFLAPCGRPHSADGSAEGARIQQHTGEAQTVDGHHVGTRPVAVE
jgi:hypothetical protein